METILVLTNFSKSARNAEEAAVDLASKLSANVLLLNTYVAKPIVSLTQVSDWPFGDMPLTKEESLNYLEEEVYYLQGKLDDKVNVTFKPELSITQKEGSIANHINNIQKEYNIKVIFMGGGQHDFLFGNHVRAILDEVNCLLMIVPHGKGRIEYKNLCYATDLNKDDLHRIKFLNKYLRPLSTHLHICHVSVPNFIPDFMEEDQVPEFKKALEKIDSPFIHYYTLEGNNVIDALEEFNKQTDVDLLVLAHKSHGLFWRTFNQDLSKMLLRDQQTPLLIMP